MIVRPATLGCLMVGSLVIGIRLFASDSEQSSPSSLGTCAAQKSLISSTTSGALGSPAAGRKWTRSARDLNVELKLTPELLMGYLSVSSVGREKESSPNPSRKVGENINNNLFPNSQRGPNYKSSEPAPRELCS